MPTVTTAPHTLLSTTHCVFVRHGRTALNADGRLRGQLNPGLDEGVESLASGRPRSRPVLEAQIPATRRSMDAGRDSDRGATGRNRRRAYR